MANEQSVVAITGASRGIGAAAARAFAKDGAKIALLARSGQEIGAIADEIGDNATAFACDVSRFDDVAVAFETVEARLGPISAVIANAGVVEPISHLAAADPTGWGSIIDVNLKGVFHTMRASVPGMVAAGGGTFITISSGAAHGPVEAWSAYCASKAGAAMLTRCLDKEYGEKGIRAMGLSPGTVATEMQRQIKASGINPVSQLDWTDHIPPEWPARALVWMAGPAGDAFLGQEISLRDENIRRAVGLID
ncbi:MAG: SDR family oxidoreductase [Pseudomonadota bacterium]